MRRIKLTQLRKRRCTLALSPRFEGEDIHAGKTMVGPNLHGSQFTPLHPLHQRRPGDPQNLSGNRAAELLRHLRDAHGSAFCNGIKGLEQRVLD